METTTFDVASSATRLQEALDDGRIADEKLAEVVIERLKRVKGISEAVTVGEATTADPVKASVGWTHTWKWPL